MFDVMSQPFYPLWPSLTFHVSVFFTKIVTLRSLNMLSPGPRSALWMIRTPRFEKPGALQWQLLPTRPGDSYALGVLSFLLTVSLSSDWYYLYRVSEAVTLELPTSRALFMEFQHARGHPHIRSQPALRGYTAAASLVFLYAALGAGS